MTIELCDPPKRKERRTKYKKVIEQVVAAEGEWVRVTYDEIAPGATAGEKQARILQAAMIRGIKVQTTAQDGALFIRLRNEQV